MGGGTNDHEFPLSGGVWDLTDSWPGETGDGERLATLGPYTTAVGQDSVWPDAERDVFSGSGLTDHYAGHRVQSVLSGTMDCPFPMEAENEDVTHDQQEKPDEETLSHDQSVLVDPTEAGPNTLGALSSIEGLDVFETCSQRGVKGSFLPFGIPSIPTGVANAYDPRLHKLVHLQPDKLDLSVVEKGCVIEEVDLTVAKQASDGQATQTINSTFPEQACDVQDAVAKDQSISHAASLSSEQIEKDGVKAPALLATEGVSVEDMVLHELFHIKADKLDLSFVEKLMVSQDGIILLCNTVSRGSAAAEEGGIMVDFGALNMVSTSVVGLYGSKRGMLQMLRKLGMLEDCLQQTTEFGQLRPGLYGLLKEEALYILYWHQGERMQKACRKDASCNFVRYLFDLCGRVYVCLDEEDLSASLEITSSKSAASVTKRAQRFQLSTDKNPRYDVVLREGFQLCPSGLACPSSERSDVQSVTSSVKASLTEGGYRVAVLTATECLPVTKLVRSTYRMKLGELPKVVKKWSSCYNLDISGLPSEELPSFFLHADVEGSEDYRAFRDGCEKRKKDLEDKYANLDSMTRRQEETLTDAFKGLINLYLKGYYSWEENTLATVKPQKFMGSPVCFGMTGPSMDTLQGGADELVLHQTKLCKAWTGCSEFNLDPRAEPSQLIFVGSRILLMSETVQMVYLIKWVRRSHAGPIMVNEKFEAVGEGDGRETTITLRPIPGDCPAGPVVTSQRYRGVISNEVKERIVKVRLVSSNSDLMMKWIHTFGADVIPKLEKKTYILSLVMKNPGFFGADVFDHVKQSLHKLQALKSSSPLPYYQSQFSDAFVEPLFKNLAYGLTEASIDIDGAMEDQVLKASKEVYRTSCSNLASRIVTNLIRKQILVAVRENLVSQKNGARKILEGRLAEETLGFLNSKRKQIQSTQPRREHTLSIQRCILENRRQGMLRGLGLWGATDQGDRDVTLHYTCEEPQEYNVSWAISELGPLKKDLDILGVDKSHVIVPKSTSKHELITIPKTEQVWKVFMLKCGQILVFAKRCQDEYLNIYLSPRPGSKVAAHPVQQFRRGFDLVAFDEVDGYIALCDSRLSKVVFYKCNLSFQKFESCCTDLSLSEFSGSKDLTCILFRPGYKQMVLLDTDNRVRVFQIYPCGMMKPKSMSVPVLATKACVTPDGSCLVIFHHTTDATHGQSSRMRTGDHTSKPSPSSNLADGALQLFLYHLESLSHLKQLTVGYDLSDVAHLNAAIVSFGPQIHLVLYDTSRPNMGLCSKILDVNTASQGLQLQSVRPGGLGGRQNSRKGCEATGDLPASASAACPALEYVALVFQKYATSPPLMQTARELDIHIVLGSGTSCELITKMEQFQKRCVPYVNASIDKIKQDEGKCFSHLIVTVKSDFVDNCFGPGNFQLSASPFGDWVRLLMCMAPIQICRAENNCLRPLRNGLQISEDAEYDDAVSLSRVLGFGFYDAILTHWPGSIKVISSMGKQSSGKSYLLNHLSGSVLDVAGGRCTDGVWMTMRPSADCLYVLLDFEGLGSFERSEQEDMLLSIANAAVSNVTIFNQKDSHLDKEMETLFGRIHNGVSLVKRDSHLFKGLFLMALKDVGSADVEDLKAELSAKIAMICSKSQENFLTSMYCGEIEIVTMPPFQQQEYQQSLITIAETIRNLDPVYGNGRSLLTDFKLLIAQIATRDWSPINAKRVALRLDYLKGYLESAICLGRLGQDSDCVQLLNMDTQEPIADVPLAVDGHVINLSDSEIQLLPGQVGGQNTLGITVQSLREAFDSMVRRPVTKDEDWHLKFEQFLDAVAKRRSERVVQWLDCNTTEFVDDGDVQKLRLEAVTMLAEIRGKLSVCSCKCQTCFFRCVLEKSHSSDHTCLGSHLCSAICDFCADQGASESLQNECSYASGHEGQHSCKELRHTCGQACSLVGKSSNCNLLCALEPKHAGKHHCNTRQHICNKACSLTGCGNSCTLDVNSGDHDRHVCHERICPLNCKMAGCKRKCGSDDHFHQMTSADHLCGNEHTCQALCEEKGMCEIVTALVKKQTFCGQRSSFEFEHMSEQNGIKKACCIPIPPWKEGHTGPHCHTSNPDVVHFCDVRCPSCGYFCHNPNGHAGLHDTAHGNMRNVHFAAESPDIDVLDRKYAWGESGMAEMCQMHCKARGRGHVHLRRCPRNEPFGKCAEEWYDKAGARHETKQYGPDLDVAKDEFTHQAYWELMNFKDPCQEEDVAQFGMCNHFCLSQEHQQVSVAGAHGHDSGNADFTGRSYCIQRLWHQPVTDTTLCPVGYVSRDGHAFSCQHADTKAHHVVFVIDRSGSMGLQDIKPVLAQMALRHNNRLGCVFEAALRFIKARVAAGCSDIVSFILFDSQAVVVTERAVVSEDLMNLLLRCTLGGSTVYSRGLEKANEVLVRAKNSALHKGLAPAVIFLSDGQNHERIRDPVSVIAGMKKGEPRLVLHTLLFGSHEETVVRTLKSMANAGGGTFQCSIDELGLASNFEFLARSLQPQVASLM